MLGGTFNPVHRGHVDLGLQIRDAFGLDEVLYILSAQPPHKQSMHIAPADIRWKMLTTALKPHPGLAPCDIELKRDSWSYTVDTVAQLKARYGDTAFYFISGSEGFLKIRTWKDYQRLLRSLAFIVVLRKPEHRPAVEALLKEENIPLAEGADSVCLFTYESDKLFISSTLIRGNVKASQPVDGLVDEEVKKIIKEYSLYER